MRSHLRPASLVRRSLLVATAVAALSFGSVTSAAAADAPPATAATNATSAVNLFGVPFSTAAWALLGVLLMVSGLLAASRSAARSAVLRPAPPGSRSVTALPAVADPGR